MAIRLPASATERTAARLVKPKVPCTNEQRSTGVDGLEISASVTALASLAAMASKLPPTATELAPVK
jgi:hypothetical protein